MHPLLQCPLPQVHPYALSLPHRATVDYLQLYSRVGFVHHYRPLSADEQAFVLATHWPQLDLGDHTDFTTAEAVAAIGVL